jgi:cell division cycle 2-like protein
LPNAKSLKVPRDAGKLAGDGKTMIRKRFPMTTAAGADLLSSMLSLNPDRRPTPKEILAHEYFGESPKPKPPDMFPTFPSKAGQEKRRKRSPNAPKRGEKAGLGEVDFSGIFAGREDEARGAGFALRMG